MQVRKNPWHLRLPTSEHDQWFKNLVELQSLTVAWLDELRTALPAYPLESLEKWEELTSQGTQSIVERNLWMLQDLSQVSFESLLDDTDPQDVLGRLEQTIWAVQAGMIQRLSKQTDLMDSSTALNLLEQVSWKKGRACAEARWGALMKEGQQELKSVLLAFYDAPYSSYPWGVPFLVKRATTSEVQVELRSCAHQIPYDEVAQVKPIAQVLCYLQAQWMRGFIYALNNQVTIEHQYHSSRCSQRWVFVGH